MNTEEFIETVKSYTELYDKKNSLYMDNQRKSYIWQQLSTKFDVDAKKKWNYLRDKYVREKRKMEHPSGNEYVATKQWELFNLLTFLDDSIKPQRMVENTSPEPAEYLYSECGEDNGESDVSFVSTRTSKSKPKDDAISEMFLETLQTIQKKLTSVNEDEDKIFLNSISFDMKKMSPVQKSKFKIEIILKSQQAVLNSTQN